MAKHTPYLQRRGDTFSFRIAVPSDLLPILGKREFTKSLQTTDKRIAVVKALMLAATAKQLFNGLNKTMSDSDKGKLTESLRAKKHKIQLDTQAEHFENELFEMRLRHLEEMKLAKLEAENNAFKQALTRSNPERVSTPDSSVENATEGLKRPLPEVKSKAVVRHRLSEIVPVWVRLKNPAFSTVEIYKTAVNRFESHFPELYAETIERRHVRHYVKWLESEKLSPKSIEKEHGAIRALFTIAEHEEWVSSNPAKGIMLPALKGKKIYSYTPEECKNIFSSPVFVNGERPVAGKGEAAYWIPLLMLFTGARREEICQLTTDRIKESEGFTYLLINPIDDDGRLKTDESKRAIPIHDQLIRMGFLAFVEKQIEAGGRQLFPLLKSNKRGQYGAKWGDWWRRYIRETVGITDEQRSPAHSFRHLFITECRRLGFREDYERALVGHAGGSRKDSHDEYGEHHIPSLAAAINKIDFRELDLSHLFIN
jgi:site-specific recombinase XerD